MDQLWIQLARQLADYSNWSANHLTRTALPQTNLSSLMAWDLLSVNSHRLTGSWQKLKTMVIPYPTSRVTHSRMPMDCCQQQPAYSTVIPWLGPEFSCQKRLKSTLGNNPVYNPEIRFDFPYEWFLNFLWTNMLEKQAISMRIGQENSTKTSLKQIKQKTSFFTLFLVWHKCDIGNWSKLNSLMMHYT